MIKAEEFRVGNYVKRKFFDNHQNKVIEEIKHTLQFGDFYWYLESCNDYDEYWGNFDPIPITEEWILNLCFEKKDTIDINDFERETEYELYNSVFGISSFKIVDVVSCYDGQTTRNWIIRIDHDTIYFWRMDYIHDLQNAYFMITGNELV
jgi:hypothetical protein